MADRYASFGAKLQYLVTSTWTTIAGVRDITGPSSSLNTVDASAHDSTSGVKEFVAGMLDSGEISFELAFDPEETAGQADLLSEHDGRTQTTYRMVFNTTNTETWEFDCFVTGFEAGNPLEGFITANVTLKITGAVDRSPA